MWNRITTGHVVNYMEKRAGLAKKLAILGLLGGAGYGGYYLGQNGNLDDVLNRVGNLDLWKKKAKSLLGLDEEIKSLSKKINKPSASPKIPVKVPIIKVPREAPPTGLSETWSLLQGSNRAGA